MKSFKTSFASAAALVLALFAFTGCESTDGGSVSGSMYYGVGFYDPWYYGSYYDNPDILVTPPPRPDRPVARPLPAPAPRPMPSIPSAPRASFHR